MAYLIQDGGLSDCTAFTYSTWIRFNSSLADTDEGFVNLLEFGNPDTANGISSKISIGVSTIDSVTSYSLGVTLAGKSDSYTDDPVGEWGSYDPAVPSPDITVPLDGSIVGLTAQVGTSPPLYDLWMAPLSTYGVGTTMQYSSVAGAHHKWRQTAGLRDPIHFTCGLSANGTADFSPGSWHHVFISVDLSGGMTNTAVPVMSTNNDNKFVYQDAFMHAVNIYVDKASILNNSGLGFITSEDNDGDESFTTTEALPTGMMPGGFLVRGGSALTNGTGDGAVLSGFQAAFPTFIPSASDPQSAISRFFAYTQVWFDTYIEATPENLAKFARSTTINGQARIVPPTNKFAAADAFGPPDVYFYRNKSSGVRYQTNNGIAGAFDAVGTITDFFPGPGQ